MKNFLGDSRKVGLITVVSLVLLVVVLTIFDKGIAREEKEKGGGVIIHYREDNVTFIDESLPPSLSEEQLPTSLPATGPEKYPGVQRMFTSPNQVYILFLQDNGLISLWNGDETRMLDKNGDMVVIGQVIASWHAEWPDPVNDDLVIVTLDDNEPFEVDLATFLTTSMETD